ncbi:unnamed protein product [Mycena citricolor]|uniref:Uncharacterized protein n=1 Tax=Mycena citricolor TaxID=2018698 RepID=A0AAD2H8P7_9AGAR|nr:unnamed protein product [Mycena citricolor]
MVNPSLDQVALISMVTESFLFGVLTTMYAAILRSFLGRKASKNIHRGTRVLPTVSVIWSLAFAHWIIDISRVQIAFLGSHPSDPVAYLSDFSTLIDAAKSVINVTVTLLADWFMIYRCWVIGERSYLIIAIPALLWLSAGVAGSGLTYLLFKLHTDYMALLEVAGPWIITYLSATLATNLFCTLFVAYRILRSLLAVRTSQRLHSRALGAVIVFLESAALYSAILVAMLVTFLLDYNGQFVLVDCMCALIGITFSMIILPILSPLQSQSTGLISTRVTPRITLEGPSITGSRLVEVVSDNDFEMKSLPPSKHTSVV